MPAADPPDPTYPDRTYDMSGDDPAPYVALVLLPHRPDCEWFVFAVPVPTDRLDDPEETPMQLALEVGQEARDTAQRVIHPAVVARRRG